MLDVLMDVLLVVRVVRVVVVFPRIFGMLVDELSAVPRPLVRLYLAGRRIDVVAPARRIDRSRSCAEGTSDEERAIFGMLVDELPASHKAALVA